MRARRIELMPPTTQAAGISSAPTIPPEGKLDCVQYGYVRVFGWDDDTEQREALRAAGIDDANIYADISDGKEAVQTEYLTLLERMRQGDVLLIKSFDRLGPTYDEVIDQWRLLTKVKRVNVVVLDVPLLDMRLANGQDEADFLADFVTQLLTYVSLRERDSIRQRQREGILAAQERGVRFGRPPKPIPKQFEHLLKQWRNREISSRKAAQQLGVAQETFLRWSRREEYQ